MREKQGLRYVIMLTLKALNYRILNLHPLDVVCRYRDSQLQVGENYLHLFNLNQNKSKKFNVNLSFKTSCL